MDQYITYNEDFHVLICRQYKFAISPDWVERHFRQFHNTILLATHQEITQYAKSLNLWPLQRVNSLPFPMVPIPDLNIISGWKCHYIGCEELRSTENQ